uniref:Uncharacterized protein n=1 Tax=Eutreptiella gymnastica TaxID=73025 RepID=A0A7S1JBL1_9EUGL
MFSGQNSEAEAHARPTRLASHPTAEGVRCTPSGQLRPPYAPLVAGWDHVMEAAPRLAPTPPRHWFHCLRCDGLLSQRLSLGPHLSRQQKARQATLALWKNIVQASGTSDPHKGEEPPSKAKSRFTIIIGNKRGDHDQTCIAHQP